VTSDAATIIKEIEVVHPAAKILVMASQAQEAEVCMRWIPDILPY
jgi:chaperonin GroEL (HSP60 family)